MTCDLRGLHWIEGAWQAAGREEFAASNPSTGNVIAPAISEALPAEVDRALVAAQQAFRLVRERDPRWPARLLEAIASQIEALGDELPDRAELETALPRTRLTGERIRTCGQLRMFAEIVGEGSWVEAVIEQGDPHREPLARPDLRRMLVARGPVVVFGASNFPLAFGPCGGDTASALAGGNPVVVKGHPSHPGLSELLTRAVAAAIDQCELPAGLFSLLQGRQHELSGWLVQHPLTQAVGFTGSERAGRALYDWASRRAAPIPVYAEMGSVNPVVILPAAIQERGEAIAKELSASMLMGGGQLCTKPGVILVVRDIERRFGNALCHEIRSAPPVTMLGRSLRDSIAERVKSIAGVEGVETVVAGEPADFARQSPALFRTSAGVFRREPPLHTEAFGPCGIVVECQNVDEVLGCITLLGGNLTGTVHVGRGEDRTIATSVIRALETQVGRVVVNGYPTGVEVGRATVHGGPYPATTDSGATSVGSAAIRRFVRPVAYQNVPQDLLAPALRDDNPLGIQRLINGGWTDRAIEPSA